MSKLFNTGICRKKCNHPNCDSYIVGKEEKIKFFHLCEFHHWAQNDNNIKPKKESKLKICENVNCLCAITKDKTYCVKCYKLKNNIELLPHDIR